MTKRDDFGIRPAHVEDVLVILQLIRDLATYERAPNDVTDWPPVPRAYDTSVFALLKAICERKHPAWNG